MDQFTIQRDEVIKSGVYRGSAKGLMTILAWNNSSQEIRIVSSSRGGCWIEVWEDVESRIVGLSYQIVGGFQMVEKWEEGERGVFVEKKIPTKWESYD